MVPRSWRLVPLVAVALLLAPPAALASFPGRDGRIGFGLAGGSEEGAPFGAIGTIRPNGTGELLLRGCSSLARFRDDCTPDYGDPSYSADGRRIVFDAGARLAVVRADGETIRFLAAITANDGEPAFSPNGRRLVFSGAAAPDRAPDVFTIDLRTGATRRIAAGAAQPAWSVRGVIAYVQDGAIWLRRPDGPPRRLTEGMQPDWSPSGRRLVFVRRVGHGAHLFVIRPDGRGLRRIRPRGDGRFDGLVASPVWSPSGRRIAYYDEEDGIRTIRPDGGGWRIVAEGQQGETGWNDYFTPTWQAR
jgi:hypothetical protein